jgi:adenosylcobinamide-GDP ribazoletransferase
MIAREARRLLAAAAFLTRLPLAPGGADEELGRAARYFPLVGAGVGLAGVAVLAAGATALPLLVSVILSVGATVLLTGALHEDGLADACDAFGGGASREEVFRILKDSRIGAYGALGLILVLALKIASLAQMPVAVLPLALIFAHAFSRALCVAVMAAGVYAKREGGKTRRVAAGARPVDAAIALAVGLAAVLWSPAVLAPAALVMAALAAVLYGYFRARVGGYTGDALGAIQQLTEAAAYVAVLARL